MPGNAIPIRAASGATPALATNVWTLSATAGVSFSGPTAASANVLSRPNALIMREPESDSSGNVMWCRSVNAARISGES